MATFFSDIFGNIMNIDLKMVIMWLIGGTLIYLAIAKEMEPSLLMPLGFGAILVNLPMSGVITQGEEVGAFDELFKAGIANELFPPQAHALRSCRAVRHLLHAQHGDAVRV